MATTKAVTQPKSKDASGATAKPVYPTRASQTKPEIVELAKDVMARTRKARAYLAR